MSPRAIAYFEQQLGVGQLAGLVQQPEQPELDELAAQGLAAPRPSNAASNPNSRNRFIFAHLLSSVIFSREPRSVSG